MATTKTTKTTKTKAAKSGTTKYYYALGRRKTASATVRLYQGKGDSVVNGKPVAEFFPLAAHQKRLQEPFAALIESGDYYFTAKAVGGGTTGQLDAIVLGISRALVKQDESHKSPLKTNGLLTRDDREVERKRTGFRKARKKPQFSKR